MPGVRGMQLSLGVQVPKKHIISQIATYTITIRNLTIWTLRVSECLRSTNMGHDYLTRRHHTPYSKFFSDPSMPSGVL